MPAVTVTAKIRIRPDADTETALSATMAAYRDACNMVSEYVFRTRSMRQLSVQQDLYRRLREKFRLRSQMAVSVVRTVVSRYKALLSAMPSGRSSASGSPSMTSCGTGTTRS